MHRHPQRHRVKILAEHADECRIGILQVLSEAVALLAGEAELTRLGMQLPEAVSSDRSNMSFSASDWASAITGRITAGNCSGEMCLAM